MSMVHIQNHNSNGRYVYTTWGTWGTHQAEAGFLIPWTFTASNPETIGSSKRGRVMSVGQRRAHPSNAWGSQTSAPSQTW